MNVSLTPELEDFIQKRVRSGRYHSASEVVREALRLLEDQDEVRRLRLDEMRKRIAAGLASLDRGEAEPGEQVFDELEAGLSSAPAERR
jgi:antitoxin ParD1/3/4